MGKKDKRGSHESKTKAGKIVTRAPSVLRSSPPVLKDYHAYLPALRVDFWHSCAYCTISEVEAQGIGFQIDHYWPRKHFKHLESDYDNLMYSCSRCNGSKSDYPNPGYGPIRPDLFVLRPDRDISGEHLRLKEDTSLLEHRTPTGEFNIHRLDLNRQALRRVREFRRRLSDATTFIEDGFKSILDVRLDELSPQNRFLLQGVRKRLMAENSVMNEKVSEFVRSRCRSPLLEQDIGSKQRAADRREYLAAAGVIVPKKA